MTRPRIAIAVVSTALLALFVVFLAFELADSQSDSRDEIEQRFHERPEITAALTESLFAATTTSAGDELTRSTAATSPTKT